MNILNYLTVNYLLDHKVIIIRTCIINCKLNAYPFSCKKCIVIRFIDELILNNYKSLFYKYSM